VAATANEPTDAGVNATSEAAAAPKAVPPETVPPKNIETVSSKASPTKQKKAKS